MSKSRRRMPPRRAFTDEKGRYEFWLNVKSRPQKLSEQRTLRQSAQRRKNRAIRELLTSELSFREEDAESLSSLSIPTVSPEQTIKEWY